MNKFTTGKYYHVYNRGVEKRVIFEDNYDYQRFVDSIKEFNVDYPIGSLRDMLKYRKNNPKTSKPGMRSLVDIVAYCLNPNHYHFILKQNVEGGISEFMRKVGLGYTGYFNKRYDRSGILFQGRVKSVYVDSNEYLLYLSAYINQNHYIHGYKEKEWIYSSLIEYQNKKKNCICNKEIIMKQFNNNFIDYQKFMKLNAEYLKDKKAFKKLILE